WGVVMPERFISVAEECGLIIPIGRWVLSEACAQLVRWSEIDILEVSVAVNISTLEFRHRDFLANALAIFDATGVDRARIQLELTESVLMHDVAASALLLAKFKAMGVQIAVDDFGTGYSSLSALHQFPLTGLKIDRSFVKHLAERSDYRAIIDAASATRIDTTIPEQAYLGPLGFPGFAAYIGMLQIGKPRAGETVFVSAAAGSVGSLAVQIAKIKECRVVASAGGEDKLRWLREEAGADATINYKNTDDMVAALREAAPKGVDIYFDNVGGTHLEAALEAANDFARFALCGMIEQYNSEPVGPRNIYAVIEKSLLLQGF
ncbi:hypothetical protein LTR94_028306, partial [Friedmanniomyces endolithicus]